MGFKDARSQLIAALSCTDGTWTVLHEERDDATKNLLKTGEVQAQEVCTVLRCCQGQDYSSGPHHQVASVTVHIIQRRHQNIDWYIKWYVIEPSVYFISVHH